MLILPLIDLLILMGSACLGIGFVLKSIEITTHYNPLILGFSTIDFVLMAGVCLGFALALAARTWVKLNEPKLLGQTGSPFWLSRKGNELEKVAGIGDSDEDRDLPLADAAAGGRRR